MSIQIGTSLHVMVQRRLVGKSPKEKEKGRPFEDPKELEPATKVRRATEYVLKQFLLERRDKLVLQLEMPYKMNALIQQLLKTLGFPRPLLTGTASSESSIQFPRCQQILRLLNSMDASMVKRAYRECPTWCFMH